MGIKRGEWKSETFSKMATVKSGRHGARPAPIHKEGVSNSEHHLNKRGIVSVVEESIPEGISEYRRAELIRGTERAIGSENSPSPVVAYSASYKRAQEIKESYGLSKTAGVSISDGSRLGASGGTIRQAPEVYSPLFQIANLQLPRDRITMNAWNRNFYDTHPLVHNCINLHATYPISKINIKCKDPHIEQFFKDMAEEINLTEALQMVALEFWKIGETFPYAELDENRGMWKNIIIQNPDYIHVKTSVMGGDPVISMRPDAALQRLVHSSAPADVQLRKQIDEEILYHVKKGNNIPLDNFHVSHLKMMSSPYDIHGTSPIVSVYKDLMLYDKLRESKFAQADNLVNPITLVKVGGSAEGEYHPTSDDLEKWRQTFECYDEKTEVLTDEGFKKFDQVMSWVVNEDGKYTATPNDGVKIACFNKDNNKLEYYQPSRATLYDYNDNMYHFNGNKVDVCVTPNHRMWASKRLANNQWADWEIIKAEDLTKSTYKFRSVVDFDGEELDTINVCGEDIKTDDYLEFLGNIISEGYVCECNGYANSINLYQEINTKEQKMMKRNMEKIAKCFNKGISERVYSNDTKSFSTSSGVTMWKGILYNSKLVKHIYKEIGENDKCNSHNKRIPRWAYSLSRRQMKILLDAMVAGDGTVLHRSDRLDSFRYNTISKNLAYDVGELVFLIGYAPNIRKVKNGQGKEYWMVSWADNNRGKFPFVSRNENARCAHINIVPYKGKVWCLTVPTGLFVTKRNNLISIQGNSAQYDKDFKIITHAGVAVERVGASGAIIDINQDMTFILDNILYGLMVPKSVVTQEGASFNSATVGLEVLKQRYETFRNMMAQWLTKKIFAPISEIQEFYEYKDGDKKLIVPEVEWNRMILFDMDNYINVLNGLVQQSVVSKTTLFRSLGLNMEEERRLIREEMVQQAITAKEVQILQGMQLGALRALKPDEDIIEPTEAPLPGTPGAEESGVPGAGGLGGMPGGLGGGLGGGGGGMPPMPPMGGGGGGGLGGPPPGGDMGGLTPGPGGGDLGGPPPGGEAGGGAGGGAPPV